MPTLHCGCPSSHLTMECQPLECRHNAGTLTHLCDSKNRATILNQFSRFFFSKIRRQELTHPACPSRWLVDIRKKMTGTEKKREKKNLPATSPRSGRKSNSRGHN